MSPATATLPPLQLPQYQITETIYQGPRTAVYRGTRRLDGAAVVIKVLQHSHPSFHDLLQFRNQYTLTQGLNIPGVVQLHSLESYGHGYALVMPDFGGLSLQQYCQGRALALSDVLAIALQMADILHALGQHRVIHKDIKPANILIQPQTQQIQLIDFSIASLLPRETQEIQPPQALEGTLAYLSPEQTGRMNRGIDYRSDFYALGVTLYELATGQLPFTATDPMELVHCHLAQSPLNPHSLCPAIPPTVAEIILKLLAKNAEDRYQSATGLKRDLLICQAQWSQTHDIQPFDLGQGDQGDRFLIPEKLYGRSAEAKALLNAFERVAAGQTEMMLVAGFSGIGKTAVVNEVHRPIVQQRGYFIKGKFDQLNRNIPLSAFVQALRDLMRQLLSESDAQLAQWKAKILQALGDSGQIVIDVVPELAAMIGPQPAVPALAGMEAQNRFNRLMGEFIQVFAAQPLVLFLDDLQWADLASIGLIELLMQQPQGQSLLLLGAYRDNEVSPSHPLMVSVQQLHQAAVPIQTLTLAPLPLADVNHLIADTLNCSAVAAQPLAQQVYQKTEGNPFFTNQLLKSLHAEGWIAFEPQTQQWQCDLTQIKALALSDDVVTFMTQRLQKLPLDCQHMLKLAACIGNQFDLATLATVCEQSDLTAATALWPALQEGLILPQNDAYKFFQSSDPSAQAQDPLPQTSVLNSQAQPAQTLKYRFLHDRIQQAAYSLIALDQRQATHQRIGQLLLAKSTAQEQESRRFEIVNHLNRGADLLTTAAQRLHLAQLNQKAGEKAQQASASAAALDYFTTGIQLLGNRTNSPAAELTELGRSLYNGATEAAYLEGEFDQMEQFAAVILQQTSSVLEQIHVYEVKLKAYVGQTCIPEAIALGLQVLEQLGVKLPSRPHQAQILAALLQTKLALAGKSPASLQDKSSTDPRLNATVRMLITLGAAAYAANPELFVLLVLKVVRLSVRYGNVPGYSAYGYSIYAMILVGVLGDIDQGYEFGQLSLRLLEQSEARQVEAKVYMTVSGLVAHWKGPLAGTLKPLLKAYGCGLETGDLEFAAYSATIYFANLLHISHPLSQVEREGTTYVEALARMNQNQALTWLQVFQQTVLNLLGKSADPCQITGTICDETQLLELYERRSEKNAIAFLALNKMILGYLFENFDQVHEYAKLYEQHMAATISAPPYGLFHWYDALAQFTRWSELPKSEQQRRLRKADSHQKKLQKWAHHAPMNYAHKAALVSAERCRVLGLRLEAIEYYDQAIAGAKANALIHEAGIANECAAKFYLDWGKQQIAATYMQDAYYCYAQWEAIAKVEDLVQRYPQLLQPILQAPTASISALETLASIYSTSLAPQPSFMGSGLNQQLDLTLLLQSAQSMIGVIEFDQLMQVLANIMLEHSGADHLLLVLPQDQDWQVRVIADLDQIQLTETAIAEDSHLPLKLIQYLKNTATTLVIDQLETDLPIVDAYLTQHQPKSLLGLPILKQGTLTGILILENRVARGIFNRDRLAMLTFLASQAAVAIENATFYLREQDKTAEIFQANQRLELAMTELKQSQAQVVQSEKMSALGNLVAGVAHEINNPIGFLKGSISNAQDYCEDMLGHIALYQQHYANAAAPIQENAEDIDLDYLQADLPKLLTAMQGATDRIKTISTSLRTFSRADTEHAVLANIQAGIDSTILILKYRLKANEYRPAIEVVTDYGKIPEIKCFPGQLNQVFMNILANAIDMFDEMAQAASFQDIKANPQTITIQTALINSSLEIRIHDNGKGMPESVRDRIFDHLFTTKAVGKGTGLGLAIAHQIVVETHGGQLSVESELGQGSEFCITLPLG